ncbi:MAG: type II secretion system protein GspD [Burkholderiales bacterium]
MTDRMQRKSIISSRVLVPALALLLTACAQAPLKPSDTHLRTENVPQDSGSIPPPVQMVPVLPRPSPAVKPETYSVVVSNVRVQDLLFALARDAKVNIDIHPGVEGFVTLNAIDQTLPQLLSRLSRQVDMRYELDGQNLLVMRDTPFLRAYQVDYLSANRTSTMKSTASTQFGSGSSAGGSGGGSGGSTGGTASIEVAAENKLWDSLVQNVKDILRETDKVVPKTPAATPQQQPAAPQPQGTGAQAGTTQAAPAAAPTPPATEFIELASVIGNRESGALFVRATSRQHEKVREFLDLVMASVKRQVLIEATIAEVQLNNEYQRGIAWDRVAGGGRFTLLQPLININPLEARNSDPFLINFRTNNRNFGATLQLLEEFGDVRVVSSPKLSVLNNQPAILRVTRDIIYFTMIPASTGTTTISAVGDNTQLPPPAFTTTPVVAAEGFLMTVLPQISDADTIMLSVRPTIRRRVGEVQDPNPALRGQDNQNPIPVFETREFDSILRLQSGDVGVLAGLMQDQAEGRDAGIPGVRSIPGIGDLLAQKSQLSRKTELVIFLRATVLRDPSLSGDFGHLRGLLPSQDFFSKPNPGRIAPPLGPSGEPLR